jgi:D-Tyr-tRNAtyr deacylase
MPEITGEIVSSYTYLIGLKAVDDYDKCKKMISKINEKDPYQNAFISALTMPDKSD